MPNNTSTEHEITIDPESTTKYTVKRDNSCAAMFCGLFAAALILILIGVGMGASAKYNAITSNCYVTNVTFPTEIPTNPADISDNFISCDCGKFCTSDLGYCVKVFVSIEGSNTTQLLGNQVTNSPFVENQVCSFGETDCNEGEQLSDRIQSLDVAKELATPYLNYMTQSTAFDCFEHDGNAFANNDVDVTTATLISVGVLTLICLISSLYCVFQTRK